MQSTQYKIIEQFGDQTKIQIGNYSHFWDSLWLDNKDMQDWLTFLRKRKVPFLLIKGRFNFHARRPQRGGVEKYYIFCNNYIPLSAGKGDDIPIYSIGKVCA